MCHSSSVRHLLVLIWLLPLVISPTEAGQQSPIDLLLHPGVEWTSSVVANVVVRPGGYTEDVTTPDAPVVDVDLDGLETPSGCVASEFSRSSTVVHAAGTALQRPYAPLDLRLNTRLSVAGGHVVDCQGCLNGFCLGKHSRNIAASARALVRITLVARAVSQKDRSIHRFAVRQEGVLNGATLIAQVTCTASDDSTSVHDGSIPSEIVFNAGRDPQLTVTFVLSSEIAHEGGCCRRSTEGDVRLTLTELPTLLESGGRASSVREPTLPFPRALGTLSVHGEPRCLATRVGERTLLTARACVLDSQSAEMTYEERGPLREPFRARVATVIWPAAVAGRSQQVMPEMSLVQIAEPITVQRPTPVAPIRSPHPGEALIVGGIDNEGLPYATSSEAVEVAATTFAFRPLLTHCDVGAAVLARTDGLLVGTIIGRRGQLCVAATLDRSIELLMR